MAKYRLKVVNEQGYKTLYAKELEKRCPKCGAPMLAIGNDYIGTEAIVCEQGC